MEEREEPIDPYYEPLAYEYFTKMTKDDLKQLISFGKDINMCLESERKEQTIPAIKRGIIELFLRQSKQNSVKLPNFKQEEKAVGIQPAMTKYTSRGNMCIEINEVFRDFTPFERCDYFPFGIGDPRKIIEI